ncbi:MAG: efflux RND transporter permease subunit [Burkholderiaceae bacterium]
MNRLIEWMAAHPVAANLLMVLILIAGVSSGLSLKQEVFPEINFDTIETRVVYQGASPDEIEESIVQRIEEQIESIDGVDKISGIAAEGLAVVRVQLVRGAKSDEKLDEIKAAIDRITSFPEQSERPITREIANRNRVLEIAVYGDAPESTLREQAYRLKDALSALPGISLAQVAKVREYEISIDVSNQTLRSYGLSLQSLAQTVRQSSLDLPGGDIKTGSESILLRTIGRNYTARDFEDIIVVSAARGTNIRLGDIATVRDSFRDQDLIMRYNSKPAAFVQVFRVGEEKVLDVVAAAERYIEEKSAPSLPPGLTVEVWQNSATEFNNRRNLLMRNGIIGIVLVMLALTLFLDIRLAFWVSAGIAVSFVGAFAVMPLFGLSINMMSLFGFILAIGIVVDDAIVMGENIFSTAQRGGSALQAAVDGAKRVAVPVLLAVSTTIVAFVPLLTVPGTVGKFLFQIPAIVMIVLVISVIEAIFIMPHHLAYLKINQAPRSFIGRTTRRIRNRVDGALRRFVDGPLEQALYFSTRHYGVIIASAFGIFVLTLGIITAGYVKFSFFPQVEGRTVTASIELTPGTQPAATLTIAQQIETAAREADAQLSGEGQRLINTTYVSVGEQSRSGPGAAAALGLIQGNRASIVVELIDPEERTITGKQFERRWREKVGDNPAIRKISFASNLINLGSPIQVQLSARNPEALARAVSTLRLELERIDGVYDVRDDREPGKREVQFRLKPYARTLGITVDSLSRQVRAAFYGAEATRVQRGRDEVRVFVRLPAVERNALSDLREYRIQTPGGDYVPLQQLADVSLGYGTPTIIREDGVRRNTVIAEVDGATITGQQVNSEIVDRILPGISQQIPDLSYAMGGEQREQGQALPGLARNFLLAVFCMYAILALAFRSYIQPFLVIAAIPFGLVGATIGHLLLDLSFGLTSIFGIVGLSGIIVNGSLVLIDFINEQRSRGLDMEQAIVTAAKSRFRPVFLTAVTTFLGIFPLIIERSIQAQFLIPLAISIGVGVLMGTFLLMLLTPALVMWQHDSMVWWRRILGRNEVKVTTT